MHEKRRWRILRRLLVDGEVMFRFVGRLFAEQCTPRSAMSERVVHRYDRKYQYEEIRASACPVECRARATFGRVKERAGARGEMSAR